MRISGSVNADTMTVNKTIQQNNSSVDSAVEQESNVAVKQVDFNEAALSGLDNNEDTKAKVQEAVNKMNDMLEVNNSTSKFMYHEGLERYYVTIVDKETEEVIKEIPAKKLLDSYYEMQKMLGMVVDEKI